MKENKLFPSMQYLISLYFIDKYNQAWAKDDVLWTIH